MQQFQYALKKIDLCLLASATLSGYLPSGFIHVPRSLSHGGIRIKKGIKKGDAANSVRHGCWFVGRFGFRFVVSVEEPRLSIRVYCFHLETAQHESPH